MTVGDVRRRLQEMTHVQPKRQKLIGLGKKPNPDDNVTLDSLHLKRPHSFMMVRFAAAVNPDRMCPLLGCG